MIVRPTLRPFTSGMKKTGDWTPSSSSSFTTIPSWSIKEGYPKTLISGDGMVVKEGTYALNLYLLAGDSFNLSVRSIRIMVDSTEVLGDTHAGSNGWNFNTILTIPNGLLTVQYYASSTTSSRRTVREGTYITIDRI